MTEDLDGRDFAEVRRRVIAPVLQALLSPEEIRSVRLQFGPPHAEPYDDGYDSAADVWVSLVDPDGDQTWFLLGQAGHVARWDAREVADRWADELVDWVAESSFGWGQLRCVDVGAVVLPAAWPQTDPGNRCLEMYAATGVISPLWERGVNIPLATLPLSAGLAADLTAWQATFRRLEASDAFEETDEDVAAWRSLDPMRVRLLRRLRDELPDPYIVKDPLPRPPNTAPARAPRES